MATIPDIAEVTAELGLQPAVAIDDAVATCEVGVEEKGAPRTTGPWYFFGRLARVLVARGAHFGTM